MAQVSSFLQLLTITAQAQSLEGRNVLPPHSHISRVDPCENPADGYSGEAPNFKTPKPQSPKLGMLPAPRPAFPTQSGRSSADFDLLVELRFKA